MTVDTASDNSSQFDFYAGTVNGEYGLLPQNIPELISDYLYFDSKRYDGYLGGGQ